MWLMSVLCHINFRGENGGEVRYAEASMRNGFGLKYIHKFFNLPFIQLQVCLLELNSDLLTISSTILLIKFSWFIMYCDKIYISVIDTMALIN